MGSDSGKTHETFTVAPADDPTDEDVDAHLDGGQSPVASQLAQISALTADSEMDAVMLHAWLTHLTADAHHQLDQADLTDEEKAEHRTQVAAAAADALASCDDSELCQLAAAHGFAHPTLVGLSPASQHPLVYWLNPAYPAEATSKAKIAAKADERYAQLAAGEVDTVGGQTLEQVHAAEAQMGLQPTGGPTGGWQASAGEFAAAQTALSDAVTALPPPATPAWQLDGDGGLTGVLNAERDLLTADCSDLDESQQQAAKAAATALVDKQLDALPSHVRRRMIAQAAADAHAAGDLDEPCARWLDRESQLAVLRAATDADTHNQLIQKAAGRDDDVGKLAEATAAVSEVGATPPDHMPETMATWADTHAVAATAKKAVANWATHAADYQALVAMTDAPLTTAGVDKVAANQTTQFRQWAKTVSLTQLRAAAAHMGMEPTAAKAATRAQVQNWIAASWDPKLSQADIQAQAHAKPAKKSAAATPTPSASDGTTATSTPTSTPGPSSGASTAAGGPGSWSAKHAAGVAVLQAHQAAVADIPEPQPPATIAGLELSAGTPAAVGGAHAKTLHTDPSGGVWLHKPDKSGGARAHAESAAAGLCNLAGVRTPPVYVKKVDGTTGAAQPWIGGAEPLSAEPSSWSQADVDALCRFHVAAWMSSNHDGNPSNVLRTPSGGLAPIDHGQAWRYFGTDQLSVDYDPNSGYGNPPPAYVTAYTAATTGGLASGVKVRPEAALPTIAAFERMPDAQLRSQLAGVAEQGVKAGVPWAKRMRAAAAKRHNKPASQVTDDETATEFLDQAVERKRNLRNDFAAFFAGLGLNTSPLEKAA